MEKIKYIHMLLCDEFNFSTRIIDTFQDKKNGFDISQHLFVTPYKAVYEAHKDLVKYEDKKLHVLINKYSPICDFIFLHSINYKYEIIKLKRPELNKIVWRTWGHDANLFYCSGIPFGKIVKRIFDPILIKKYQQFKAIGIANLVDMIDIEEKFRIPRNRMFVLPYPDRLNSQYVIEHSKDDLSYKKKNEQIKVLVGHSGVDDQISAMKSLEKFKGYPIHLISIISYGPEDNINKITEYGSSAWKDRITFIREFLSYDKYAEIIRNTDIGILQGKQSYALGCISLLLLFKKKIFLNKDGIIRKAFDYDNVPYGLFQNIEEMSFEDFIKPVDYPANPCQLLETMNYEEYIGKWYELFSFLNHESYTNTAE